MILKVKVNDKIFEVEVGDLRERPIMAVVDGETFEVWPESRVAYTSTTTSRSGVVSSGKSYPTPATVLEKISTEGIPPNLSAKAKTVRAPIPGVITAISIQVGDAVETGQELCKLEAMKMNNSIRATHAGRIASIQVSIGQQVKHGDTLMEYAEE